MIPNEISAINRYDSSLKRPDYLKGFLFWKASLLLGTNHPSLSDGFASLTNGLTTPNHDSNNPQAPRILLKGTLKCGGTFSGSPGNTPESTTKTFSSDFEIRKICAKQPKRYRTIVAFVRHHFLAEKNWVVVEISLHQ